MKGINDEDDEAENDHASVINLDEGASDAMSEDDDAGSIRGMNNEPEVVTTLQLNEEIRTKAKSVSNHCPPAFTSSLDMVQFREEAPYDPTDISWFHEETFEAEEDDDFEIQVVSSHKTKSTVEPVHDEVRHSPPEVRLWN